MKLKKLSLFVLASCSGSAFAAGFQINELSPTIQAAALSDAATASGDISGMGYNPATLATVNGPDIYAGASVIIPKIGYSNAQGNVASVGQVGTVTSEANIAPTAYVPNLYMGDNINKLHFGLGVNAPFGLTSQYNSNWVGQDNAIESQIQTVQISPTLAYAFSPNFTVGAALDVTYADAIYSNHFDGWLNLYSGTTRLSGHSWGEGYTLGAMYKPTSSTTLGADYHSKQDEDISGNALTTWQDILNIPLPTIDPNGSAVIDLPQVVNLGVAQQITNKFTVMMGGQWTGWSSMQAIDADISSLGNSVTPLNWSNTWLYSLGASYQATQRWKILGGLAYDETPTNNTDRDPRIPDSNRWWLTTGLVYAPSKNLAFNLAYEHLFMANQTVNVTQQASSSVDASTISAQYSGYANIIAGSFNYTF